MFEETDPFICEFGSYVFQRRLAMLVFNTKLNRVSLKNLFHYRCGKRACPASMVKWGSAKAIDDLKIAIMFQEASEDGFVGTFAHKINNTIAELIAWVRT
mmetsp:Transcript_23853/g.67908  ORF Transcript_23853/g.67908 Transcript_23853/m.67908 type:complete len:100 (+) Transcript_23853:352-651(+)